MAEKAYSVWQNQFLIFSNSNTMTSESINMISKSWDLLSRDPQLVTRFYNRLFDIAPETRRYFKDDISKQSEKLAHTLNFLVMNLDRLDEIKESIEDLGRHHNKMKIKAEYYVYVKEALLTTIQETLDEQCESGMVEAWDHALSHVASTMINAPKKREKRKLSLWARLFPNKAAS